MQANYLFRVQVWILFVFLIGFGLRNDARQLPHKCGQKMITNNRYHGRRKKNKKRKNNMSQKRGNEKIEKEDLKFFPEIVELTHQELLGLKRK